MESETPNVVNVGKEKINFIFTFEIEFTHLFKMIRLGIHLQYMSKQVMMSLFKEINIE